MYNFSEYNQKVYIREQYYNEEIFPEGMKVRNGNDRVGTIIRRGPNYVICLDEDHKTFRSWISDINEVHELGTDETREYLQDLTPGQKKERYGKTKTPESSTSINKRKSTYKEMYNDSYSDSLIKRSSDGIAGKECYGEVENKKTVEDQYSSSLMDATLSKLSSGKLFEGSMKQARANVGADSCWDGYKAKGTKKKGGKDVPNCVKEEDVEEGYGKKKMEGLDAVGKEDGDVDNDGDKDKSDKYLMKRRKAIGKAIGMKKEEHSDWRSEMGLEEGKGKKTPKGYHRMPDGSLMKDSESMDEGNCNNSKKGTKCPVHGTDECKCDDSVDEGCGSKMKVKKY
tara:strand:- start:1355 stop:2374 length:1020 start_codon:yes stop_codon:yes gene_type:complete